MASDTEKTVPCPAAHEASVAAPKRRGKVKAVVPADAVPDLALSADDVKKAKQRDRMREYMAARRAKERAAKQQAMQGD